MNNLKTTLQALRSKNLMYNKSLQTIKKYDKIKEVNYGNKNE